MKKSWLVALLIVSVLASLSLAELRKIGPGTVTTDTIGKFTTDTIGPIEGVANLINLPKGAILIKAPFVPSVELLRKESGFVQADNFGNVFFTGSDFGGSIIFRSPNKFVFSKEKEFALTGVFKLPKDELVLGHNGELFVFLNILDQDNKPIAGGEFPVDINKLAENDLYEVKYTGFPSRSGEFFVSGGFKLVAKSGTSFQIGNLSNLQEFKSPLLISKTGSELAGPGLVSIILQ